LINAWSFVLQIVFDAFNRKGATLKNESSRLNKDKANNLILVVLAEAFDAWMAFDNFTLAIQADHLRSTSSL
jgi:hypothetical protein